MAKASYGVKSRCSKRIFSGARGDFSGHMCRLNATIERNGKLYCRIHDPEVVAERNKALDAKWKAQNAAARKFWAIEKARKAIGDAAIAYVDEGGMDVKYWNDLAVSVAALHKIESGE